MPDGFVPSYVAEVLVGAVVVAVQGAVLGDVLPGESLKGLGLRIRDDLGVDLVAVSVPDT